MALTEIKTSGIADDAVTTDKLANAINTERTANTAKTSLENDSVGAGKLDLSIVQGDLIYGTGTDTWARLAKSTAGKVLTMNSGATAPEWADAAGGSSDTISEGNTKAEVVDTGSDGHFKVETEGSERFRVDSSGRVLIHTTTEGSGSADDLTITSPDGTANAGITIRCGENNAGNIYFSDATSGTGEYAGSITYAHGSAGENLTFGTSSNERVLIDSSGNLKINDGDLVIGTGGHGIDFSAQTATSATGAAITGSGSPELLDHYEEGTWTVTDLTSDGVTFTSQGNRYTRIGRQVFVTANITFPNSGLSGAAMKMGGLPFAPESGTTSSGIVSIATDVDSTAGYANGVQLHIDTDGMHGVYDGALKKGAFGNSQFQNRAVCFAFSYTTAT